jgi:hypothetical protein
MLIVFTTPPLWAGGQSSCLKTQRSGFDSRRYQICWEVVGLEWGPLSLVGTIEELRERKRCGSSLETRDYGSRDPPRWPRDTPLAVQVSTNFADKRRSLYSSLAAQSHGVLFSLSFSQNFKEQFTTTLPSRFSFLIPQAHACRNIEKPR